MRKYDLIIIGGGPAGLVAAKMARGLGKSVAIIEKEKLGGDCTWTGCVPSKALIHIANLVSALKQLHDFTTSLPDLNIDLSKVMSNIQNKRNLIYLEEDAPEVLEHAGIDVYFGQPRFADTSTIELNGDKFKAKKFIIATGSRPFVPHIEGIETVNYLTNESIFERKNLPKSIVILGGGPIGIEMACALNKLGLKITIIEMNKNILPKEDQELSSMLANRMISEGIDIKTSIELIKVIENNNEITCTSKQSDGTLIELHAESLFIAVGRKPNTEKLNLEDIGVKTTSKGITVNSKLETSVSNIYACGDVVGPYQFTHMAGYQAVIATQNAFIPFFKKHVDYTNIIWVTFSDPELASVGLNELQAREKYGDKIQVYRSNYDSIDRAKIDNTTFGLCKIVCDDKGYIVGASILGARAGELIHEIQFGKIYNYKIWDFFKPIYAYPTYSELIRDVAKKVYIQNISNKWYIKLAKLLFWKTNIKEKEL